MKSNYITHIVGVGDTIQRIAYRYGVDWTSLIVINGLEYPYIDSVVNSKEYEDTDEVAKIGDRLVIPTVGLVIPQKTNNSGKEIEALTFGGDLDLFSKEINTNGYTNVEVLGELSDNSAGDVNVCQGIANLRQQLITRLGTPKGSLMLHPDWGCDLIKYIGRRLTIERLIDIRNCVTRCVVGDFRVLGISDIQAAFKYKPSSYGDTRLQKGLFLDFIVHPIEPYSVFRIGKTFTS